MRTKRERLKQRLQESFTQFLLDFAEKLPRFQGGFIARLQFIRDDQRKQAHEFVEKTRIPSNLNLEYKGFRLLELFPIEEYEALISGLRSLFPSRPPHENFQSAIDSFATAMPNLFEGNWSTIEILHREQKELWALPSKFLPELPAGLKSVEVSVHKILPSAVVVVFDATTTSAVTEQLKEIQSRQHLPAYRFLTWMPWRRHWGRFEPSPETSVRKAILKHLGTLHSELEHAVRPHLSGFFTSSRRGPRRLPLIDTFSITGCEGDGDRKLTFRASWIQSFTMQSWTSMLDTFVGKNLAFVWKSDHSENEPPVPYRFVETYLKPPIDHNVQAHRYYVTQEIFNAALPYLCFGEAVSEVRQKLELLRVRVYEALKPNSWRRHHNEIELNDFQVIVAAPFAEGILENVRPNVDHQGRG